MYKYNIGIDYAVFEIAEFDIILTLLSINVKLMEGRGAKIDSKQK